MNGLDVAVFCPMFFNLGWYEEDNWELDDFFSNFESLSQEKYELIIFDNKVNSIGWFCTRRSIRSELEILGYCNGFF